MAGKPKIIVLITIDCLRYDYTEHILEAIPKAWGKIVFYKHYANAPYTWASFPSIFTSLPYTLYKSVSKSAKPITFLELLKMRGYYTVGYISVNEFLKEYTKEFDYNILKEEEFFKGPSRRKGLLGMLSKRISVLVNSKRFPIGVNTIYYIHGMFTILEFMTKNLHNTRYLRYPDIDSAKETLIVVNNLKSLYKRNNVDKVFVWLHYMDLHIPYNIWTRRVKGIIDTLKIVSYMVFPPNTLSGYDLNLIKSFYNISLRYVIKSIRKLMTFIEEFSDESIFIITSDHGEELMEHGALGHLGIRYGAVSYPHLYEENIRVPLIITSPNIDINSHIKSLTMHLDIAPTILSMSTEFAKCNTYSLSNPFCYFYRKVFLGNNLFNLINSSNKEKVNDLAIAESDATIIHGVGSRGEAFAIVKCLEDHCFKYIWNPILGEELYDLKKDPGEQVNLIYDFPEVAKELRRTLHQYLRFRKRFELKYKINLAFLKQRGVR